MTGRVQGEDKFTADYLNCPQGLYQEFERPIALIKQMDRAYMNMRPRLKCAIRRQKFGDYNQLTTIATDVERVLPRPEGSFFSGFAYPSNNRPRSFPYNREKPGRKIDATVNRILHSVAEILKFYHHGNLLQP